MTEKFVRYSPDVEQIERIGKALDEFLDNISE